MHTKLLDKWSTKGAFVSDNVEKQVSVCDIRSDHHGKLMHMFSIFAVKARVSPPPPVSDFSPPMLHTDTVEPSREDITIIQGNLEVLVSRIPCVHIKGFQQLKRLVSNHMHPSHVQ